MCIEGRTAAESMFQWLGAGGGGTHLLLALVLSHLTVDHVPLTKQSTVPARHGYKRYLEHFGTTHYVPSIHYLVHIYIMQNFLIISISFLLGRLCDHQLSHHKIAIIFSLLDRVYQVFAARMGVGAGGGGWCRAHTLLRSTPPDGAMVQ